MGVSNFQLETSLGPVNCRMKQGSRIVIFSHGFGVKKDSRGMFSDIASSFPDSFGYLMFDYSTVKVDEEGRENIYVRSYKQQVEILGEVLSFVRNSTNKIYVIGHSMGSIVAALLSPLDVKAMIFLAPPVHPSSGRYYFNNYPGARRDENDILVVPRRDGTITHVEDSYWDANERVDPLKALIKLAETQSFSVVQAMDEDVLRHTEKYGKLADFTNINLVKINGNHNFDPPNRQILIDTVIKLLI